MTAGDTLAMSFEGDLATAVAVSFQQCSGDVYMDMDVSFNGTSLVTSTAVETSKCVRVSQLPNIQVPYRCCMDISTT